MDSCLSTPIQYLKGVGPGRARLFQKIGLNTVEDLLYYFPRHYQDRSNLTRISDLEIGQTAAVKAEILTVNARRSFRSGLALLEMTIGDTSGKIAVVWFNQAYLKKYFKAGDKVMLYGKVEFYNERLQMSSPDFEPVDDSGDGPAAPGIVGVYSLPQGISQRVFRKLVICALDKYIPALGETLPFDTRSRQNLLNKPKSLRNIHFPESRLMRAQAYQRLAFEEFFLYQTPILLRKLRRRQKNGIVFKVDLPQLDAFRASLPYILTDSQQQVFAEIKQDMAAPFPMQRLLQGDVGSGKTVVAAMAALTAAVNGYQTAFMAPTEILANQHYQKIGFQLSAISTQQKIRIGLLTGSLSEKERNTLGEEIGSGGIDIIIGTHALLESGIQFKKLGLIVIDEQHKFGVQQRGDLLQKGLDPDCLIMTATPIPRTLSMTLYGDLDISLIRQMPYGRQEIKTFYHPLSDRGQVYDMVRRKIKEGRQAFIVYPLIEENPRLALNSAKKMHQELSNDIFKEFKVGLIHGRLKRGEQENIMRRFREGGLDVLVATTVLEVGIDVANAAVMVIEHAERFGLSQLHQMRGRIGRGTHESFCFLLSDAAGQEAQARLRVLAEHNDGFRIAEEDLKIRGPGEFFGERQHGLTELKIADPLTQMHLLKSSREEAQRLITRDPNLEQKSSQELKKQLYKRFPEFEKFMEVG